MTFYRILGNMSSNLPYSHGRPFIAPVRWLGWPARYVAVCCAYFLLSFTRRGIPILRKQKPPMGVNVFRSQFLDKWAGVPGVGLAGHGVFLGPGLLTSRSSLLRLQGILSSLTKALRKVDPRCV